MDVSMSKGLFYTTKGRDKGHGKNLKIYEYNSCMKRPISPSEIK